MSPNNQSVSTGVPQQSYEAPTYGPIPQPGPVQPPIPAHDPSAEYATKLGGILKYLRVTALVGAIIMIITTPMVLLGSALWTFISAGFAFSGYHTLAIVSIANAVLLVALLVFAIVMAFRFAAQIKNRDARAYETMMIMSVVYLVFGVADAILKLVALDMFDDFAYYAPRYIPSFLFGIVWTVVQYGIEIGVWTAYWSKSKRVLAWFGTRPVQISRFWPLVSKLPAFVWNDQIPGFLNGTPPPMYQQQPPVYQQQQPYPSQQPPVGQPAGYPQQPQQPVYAQPIYPQQQPVPNAQVQQAPFASGEPQMAQTQSPLDLSGQHGPPQG